MRWSCWRSVPGQESGAAGIGSEVQGVRAASDCTLLVRGVFTIHSRGGEAVYGEGSPFGGWGSVVGTALGLAIRYWYVTIGVLVWAISGGNLVLALLAGGGSWAAVHYLPRVAATRAADPRAHRLRCAAFGGAVGILWLRHAGFPAAGGRPAWRCRGSSGAGRDRRPDHVPAARGRCEAVSRRAAGSRGLAGPGRLGIRTSFIGDPL